MENLPVNNRNGQSYGYTLYETTITSGGLLRSGDNVRDRALVSPYRHLTLCSKDMVAIMILDMFVVAVPDNVLARCHSNTVTGHFLSARDISHKI